MDSDSKGLLSSRGRYYFGKRFHEKAVINPIISDEQGFNSQ